MVLAPPDAKGPPTIEPPKLTLPDGTFVPPRIVINGVEGVGKTTIGAYAPGCAILMAEGETGYLTLVGKKLVPKVPKVILRTWSETLAFLRSLIENQQDISKVVLDALAGFERLCHQHVCDTKFGGDWSDPKSGFMSYQKGYEVAVNEWCELLKLLDALHAKGISIIFLSHVQVRTFKNPGGNDFDRYTASCHAKTWDVTHRWADAVLFNNFVTTTEERGGKTIGTGGDVRMIHTQRCATFDAKNRYGMPVAIPLTNNPAESWDIIANAIKGGSNGA